VVGNRTGINQTVIAALGRVRELFSTPGAIHVGQIVGRWQSGIGHKNKNSCNLSPGVFQYLEFLIGATWNLQFEINGPIISMVNFSAAERPGSPTSPGVGSPDGKLKVSKSVHKAELKRKRHHAQMEKNMQPLLISALLSICFAGVAILIMLKAVPWAFHTFQSSVLDGVKWYKGAELLAVDIISERTLDVHSQLTQSNFKEQYLNKAPVLFAVSGTLKKKHYEELQNTFGGKQHGEVELHYVDYSAPRGIQTCTLESFLQLAEADGMQEECTADPDEDEEAAPSTATSTSTVGKTCAAGRATFVEYLEGAEHVLKLCGINNTVVRSLSKSSLNPNAHAVAPDLGGPLQLYIARNGRGPPFRQGRQFWAEVVHGKLQWLLFHPQALPAAGYGVNETLSAWMAAVYPKVTARDAPVLVTQEPGQVIYIPEGWFYTYSASTPLAVAVGQQSSVEQVGSPLYCLQEGKRRHALGDLQGAREILLNGIEKTKRSGTGVWMAYLASLAGRPGIAGPLGDGRGRIPFELLLELGEVYARQGEVSLAEVSFRDAISYNARYSPSFVLYVNAVLTGLEEDLLLELRKLSPKSKSAKPCSEKTMSDTVKEAALKVNAAIALAKTSKSLTSELESMHKHAQTELFMPHAGSGKFCHAQLRERQQKLRQELGHEER